MKQIELDSFNQIRIALKIGLIVYAELAPGRSAICLKHCHSLTLDSPKQELHCIGTELSDPFQIALFKTYNNHKPYAKQIKPFSRIVDIILPANLQTLLTKQEIPTQ